MGVACFKCKHFVGIDVDGNVVCERLGRVKPMIICRFFEQEHACPKKVGDGHGGCGAENR